MSDPIPDGYPPFYVVPMPYNAAGEAPEMDKDKIVGTDWQVWDQVCLSYGSFPKWADAQALADKLNDK